jgi:putative transcriptional regulator
MAAPSNRRTEGDGAMNKFSRDLMQGMKEAAAFAEGKRDGARVHVVEVRDMDAIRQQLHMAQRSSACESDG